MSKEGAVSVTDLAEEKAAIESELAELEAGKANMSKKEVSATRKLLSDALSGIEKQIKEAQAEGKEKTFEEREAELITELEQKADQRVQQAYKTFLKGMEKNNAKQRAKERRENYVRLQEQAALLDKQETRLKELETRLEVVDLVSMHDLSSGFREQIAYKDIICMDEKERFRELNRRVINLKREFNNAVKKQVEIEKQKFIVQR